MIRKLIDLRRRQANKATVVDAIVKTEQTRYSTIVQQWTDRKQPLVLYIDHHQLLHGTIIEFSLDQQFVFEPLYATFSLLVQVLNSMVNLRLPCADFTMYLNRPHGQIVWNNVCCDVFVDLVLTASYAELVDYIPIVVIVHIILPFCANEQIWNGWN